jgi:hypothetical protein
MRQFFTFRKKEIITESENVGEDESGLEWLGVVGMELIVSMCWASRVGGVWGWYWNCNYFVFGFWKAVWRFEKAVRLFEKAVRLLECLKKPLDCLTVRLFDCLTVRLLEKTVRLFEKAVRPLDCWEKPLDC